MKNIKHFEEFLVESAGEPSQDAQIQFYMQDILNKTEDAKDRLANSEYGGEFWDNPSPASEGMLEDIRSLVMYLRKVKDEGNIKISDGTLSDLLNLANLDHESVPYGALSLKVIDVLGKAIEEYAEKAKMDAHITSLFK